MKGNSRRGKRELGHDEKVFRESERTKQISLIEMFREVAELFKVETDLSGQAFIYMADALEKRKKSKEQKLFAPTTPETTIALFEKAGNEFRNAKLPVLKLVSEVWLKAAELLRQKISIKKNEKVDLDEHIAYVLEEYFLKIADELNLKLSVLLVGNKGILEGQADKGEIVRSFINSRIFRLDDLEDDKYMILESWLRNFRRAPGKNVLSVEVVIEPDRWNYDDEIFNFGIPRSKIPEAVSLDLARACIMSLLRVVAYP